jgi:hypothetical protein
LPLSALAQPSFYVIEHRLVNAIGLALVFFASWNKVRGAEGHGLGDRRRVAVGDALHLGDQIALGNRYELVLRRLAVDHLRRRRASDLPHRVKPV